MSCVLGLVPFTHLKLIQAKHGQIWPGFHSNTRHLSCNTYSYKSNTATVRTHMSAVFIPVLYKTVRLCRLFIGICMFEFLFRFTVKFKLYLRMPRDPDGSTFANFMHVPFYPSLYSILSQNGQLFIARLFGRMSERLEV